MSWLKYNVIVFHIKDLDNPQLSTKSTLFFVFSVLGTLVGSKR